MCDYVAGCDGFHGVCRASLSTSSIQTYDRAYPFAWLGILADAAPSSHELVYSLHERGFALFSMRTTSVTRLYLQCSPDDSVDNWSDDRIWNELHVRLKTDDGWEPNHGPILQKSRHGHAQLHGGADAVRSRVSRGRCRAHRAADRREGPQSRHGRRLAPCARL